MALEVIMRAVFGVTEGERLDRLRSELTRMIELVTSRSSMVLMAALGPRRMGAVNRLTHVLDPVDAVILEEIRDRREVADLEQREDILSLLLQARHEDGRPISDEELRDELMTLLVAGHETTATALAWVVERLLRHPDKLARVTDEVAA